MSDSYSVEAILSAVDKSFGSTLKSASRAIEGLEKQSKLFDTVGGRASSTFKSMLGANLVGSAISKMTSIAGAGLGSMVGELNSSTKAWKTFDGNLSQLGWGKKEIAEAKADMQDYATQTIYSASDMGTTFSQMAAIGRKDAGELVTAMGGLAASAENPGQAMKTLSQQMVQAMTKPKISWQDFKLMMEQSPAGMSAVAKEMGMSLDELVTKIQDGEVRTGDFAEAFKKAGASMQDMATNYKSVDEALGGLQETVSNKLQPIFETFSKHAVTGIESIINKLSGIKGETIQQLADNIDKFLTKLEGIDGFANKIKYLTDQFPILKNAMSFLGTTAMMAGITGGVGHLAQFGNSVSELLPKFTAVKNGFSAFGGDLANVFKPVTAGFGALNAKFPRVSAGFSNIANASSNTKNAFMGAVRGSNAARSALSMMAGESRIARVGMLGLNVVDGVSAKMALFGARFPIIGTAVASVRSKIVALTGPLSGVAGAFGSAFSGMGSIMQTFAGIAMKSLLPAAIFGAFLVGLGLLQSQFGDKIAQMVQVAVTQGPQIITNLVNGIVSQIPQLINQGVQLIQQFTQVIVANAPAVFRGAVALISALVQGVGSNAGNLISSAIQIIGVFVNGILTSLPQLLSVGMQFLVQLAQGVVQNIPLLLTTALSIVQNFISSVSQNLPNILQSGIQIIMTLVEGLISNLPQITQTGLSIIQSLLQGLLQNIPQIVAAGIQLIVQLAAALITGLPQIVQAGWNLITGLGSAMLEAIPSALNGVWEGIKNGFTSAFDWITGKSSESNAKVSADTTMTASTVTATTSQMATDVGMNMFNLSNSVSTNTANANLIGTTNFQTLTSSVSGLSGQMLTGVTNDTAMLASGVGTNMGLASTNATNSANQMVSGVNTAVSGMNLDSVNQTLQLAQGVGSNLTTANSNATTQAVAMNSGVSSNMQAMQSAGTSALSGLSSGVSSNMATASSAASSGASQIANSVNTGFNQAKSNATQSMNGIATSVTSGFNKINSTVTSGGNRMKSTFTSVFNAVKSATTSAMSNLNSSFSSGMSRAVSTAQSSGNRIISIFRNLGGQMQSAGAFAGQGFASGLAGQAGYIYSIANSIANNVAATIRRALNIHSPSRVMKEIGGFTGEGMAIGMEDSIRGIVKSAKVMALSAVPDTGLLKAKFDSIKGQIGDMSNALQSRFTNNVSGSLSATYEMNQTKEAAHFNLTLGNHSFRTFTEDITEMQDLELVLSDY
ncbi:tape measure protein [Streptococcus suis]|uniref:tape measure protein n=1 Tax=Streptococcus suis TaxID=1307 RepID=UPI002875FD53|nr:tape measure protein [Streptococcus suis]MDS1161646.1 tape measure protein [Streptococcus suis]